MLLSKQNIYGNIQLLIRTIPMPQPINPNLESFPEFGPSPKEPVAPVAKAPVGHSGNLGLEFPAQEQLGPLGEQVLSTPDDPRAIDSIEVSSAEEAVGTSTDNASQAGAHRAETTPTAPATAPQDPEKQRWLTPKKTITIGVATAAVIGAAFGIGKATAGGSNETAPKPGATSEPFPPQSTDTQPTTSINLETNSAVIVAPTTQAETSDNSSAATTAQTPESPQETLLTKEQLDPLTFDQALRLPEDEQVRWAALKLKEKGYAVEDFAEPNDTPDLVIANNLSWLALAYADGGTDNNPEALLLNFASRGPAFNESLQDIQKPHLQTTIGNLDAFTPVSDSVDPQTNRRIVKFNYKNPATGVESQISYYYQRIAAVGNDVPDMGVWLRTN
jgi:hypothetical protein